MDHADVRYLRAKRTVDERARSRRVRDRLLGELPANPDAIELGAGTGAFLPTLLGWGVEPSTYRGIDRSAELVGRARESLPDELAGGRPVERIDRGFVVGDCEATFEVGDALAVETGGADLVVAQALLDLVPIEDAVDAVERVLVPDGLAYLPITFDGVTLFEPEHPRDGAVIAAYHDHIDAQPGRDSRAGRRLLTHLGERDGELLSVAASDWIVRPRDGTYPADEGYFLDRVLAFVAEALADRGVGAEDWLATRRRQRESGELCYVAHQYDFLYRRADS